MHKSSTSDFLNSLQNLSKSEQATIQKFESDSTGASFVPVAEILRNRGYIEEAIVILEDGLLQYPQYSSARASLAKDYFTLGMLEDALREATLVLEQGPDNALAQRISLKLLIFFNRREQVLSRLHSIEKFVPDDELTSAIRKAVNAGDWLSAQKWVKADLEKSGVSTHLLELPEPQNEKIKASAPETFTVKRESTAAHTAENLGWNLPQNYLNSDEQHKHSASNQSQQNDLNESTGSTSARVGAQSMPHAVMNSTYSSQKAAHTNTLNESHRSRHPRTPEGQFADAVFQGEDNLPEALRSGSTLGHVKGDIDRYLLLKGFRNVKIGGFFLSREGLSGSRGGGIERKTIAEIYRSQKMYLKSLEIYESLIREDPKNAEFQTAFEELKQILKHEYFSNDDNSNSSGTSSNIDPDVEDSRKKIQTLRGILGKLDIKLSADGDKESERNE